MTVQFANNSEFLKAIVLLNDLQSAMCEDDEEQADALRDALEVTLSRLSWEANEWPRGLSGDLYMLCDQEVFEPNDLSAAEYQRTVLGACQNIESDPHTVLTLLRKEQDFIPPDVLAYFRGRCYSLLGLYHAGIVFLRHAVKLNPQRTQYKVVLMGSLWADGDLDQAKQVADAIFSEEYSDSRILLLTAGVMLQALRTILPVDRVALGRLKRRVEDVIAITPGASLNLLGFGHSLLGVIAETLNRTVQAQEYYSRACLLTPNDATPFLLRGRLLFKTNEQKALPDFRHAVKLGVSDPLPYLVLAREELKAGDYADCQELCLSAIKIGGPMVQGQAYEFLAIAEAQAHGETDLAGYYFGEARRLFPDDRNIQRNSEAFEQARQQHFGQVAHDVSSFAKKYLMEPHDISPTVHSNLLNSVIESNSRQLWSESSLLTSSLGMAV